MNNCDLKQLLKDIFTKDYDVSEEEAQDIVDNSPYLQKENIKKYFSEYDDYDEIEDELIDEWIDDIFAMYHIKDALEEIRLIQEGKIPEKTLEELFDEIENLKNTIDK